MEYEKTQSLISEAERALELMGRAIRIAGYQHIKTPHHVKDTDSSKWFIQVNKKTGYRGSDSLNVQYELSDGIDFDCIGNVLNKERARKNLAFQGFAVDRQASAPKGAKVNGGSLICQSLDRQGRLQNTTLMNGVDQLLIEEVDVAQVLSSRGSPQNKGQKLYKLKLQMTDGALLQINMERTFATRNLP